MRAAAMNQHQVSDVDHQSRSLPDDEHRISPMDCIECGDRSADQREIPELDRNVALASPLGRDPLDDETRSENELSEEADRNPDSPCCGIHTESVARGLQTSDVGP